MPDRPSSKSDLPLPTAAELDILAVVWRRGAATVRDIHEALGKACGYTTTQKQMQLMIGKGLLTRTDRFGVHVYEAGIPKEETQTQILSDLLDRAFEGSASNLVMRALAAKPASPKELAGIRDMIESARKKRGSSK
jgi:BlaI family transcriptional regulator, penicillinase repressor